MTFINGYRGPKLRAIDMRSQENVIGARPDLIKPIDAIVKSYVETAMVLCLGDKKLASERLGMSQARLESWLK